MAGRNDQSAQAHDAQGRATPDWALSLDGMRAQAWSCLSRGVRDRRAPSRHPTLATVSPEGWPQARTVVLRAADPAQAVLEVHTDTRSAKVAALRAAPRAALHFWDARRHLQIRLACTATLLTGDAAAAHWDRVPPAARATYGADTAPGTPIDDPMAQGHGGGQAWGFAVLCLQVHMMDLLHLGAPQRRAGYRRAQAWAGPWLAP